MATYDTILKWVSSQPKNTTATKRILKKLTKRNGQVIAIRPWHVVGPSVTLGVWMMILYVVAVRDDHDAPSCPAIGSAKGFPDLAWRIGQCMMCWPADDLAGDCFWMVQDAFRAVEKNQQTRTNGVSCPWILLS